MYHGTITLHQHFNWHTGIAETAPRHAAPLLFTCRQTYSEVALLPYKLNILSLSVECHLDIIDFLNRRTQRQLDLMVEVRCRFYNTRKVYAASAARFAECLKGGFCEGFEDALKQV